MNRPITGGGILVDSLLAHGVDRLFCVPGESYLAALDALHQAAARIEVVTCRHESGAGFMAVADAKLTGRPGVCFVSRGPGAANAAIAVHTAEQDAVPMVLLIGQVARRDRGRGAFQEVDYAKTFADMAKSVHEVSDPALLSDALARAFHDAASATPGPAVVVLPEDVLEERLEALPPATPPLPPPRVGSGAERAGEVGALLAAAERPLLIAGGGLDSDEGRAALLAAAEVLRLPVALTFRRQDLFPNRHRLYAGHLGFIIPKAQQALFAEADLILAVGTRLGDTPTQGYSLPTAPVPGQTLVHVYPDPGRIGRVFRTEYGIAADPAGFLRALAATGAQVPTARAAWLERLHGFARDLAEWRPENAQAADGLSFGWVVQALSRRLPDDAILVLDSGNFSSWLHRYFPFGPGHRLLGAVSGAMGMGVPAAVAAALCRPGRQVVALVGDGGMMMTGYELATAVRHRLPIRLFVSDNASYATIRLHQEMHYPGRTIATDLTNPDFAALARSFGAEGLSVNILAELEPAVERALAAPGPSVVAVRSSLEHITAFTTMSALAKA